MSPDPEQLARFASVEPPPELDAWVRARLRAAVAEQARVSAVPRAADTAPARAPVSVPLIERLALAVGIVACGVQASGVLVRVFWTAVMFGR
ncbi:MAG TPA: hypothetical protein VMG12_16790 [Polyangiaceae bacterium]|nr:hypothetical protein [Polyangiaceae bacterium]